MLPLRSRPPRADEGTGAVDEGGHVRTSWGSATDRGVRDVNEDALLAFPPVFLVADGMGGYDAGDLASRIVVEEFARLAGLPAVAADDIHACFARASQRVRDEFTGGRQGGTTIAGAAVTQVGGEAYWLVFNVGDSRVYRYADGGLEQVSVDHSVAQELADAGLIDADQVDRHRERHVLTRALGTGEPPEPDYWLLPAGSRDRLLVCTDGLTRELADDELAGLLGALPDPREVADVLVAEAVGRGARDNVTAVVVDVAPVAAGAGLSHDLAVTAPRAGTP